MKHKILHTISKICVAYFGMIVLFTSFIIGVQYIPQKSIDKHVYTATKLIEREGVYKQVGLHVPFFQLDNFTDCYMMNMIASASLFHPVEAAMMNYYFMDESHLEERNLAFQTESVVSGNRIGLHQQSYARYWHGYQVTLRPMLFLMDYAMIRIVNYLLFTVLTLGCLWLIRKKINVVTAIAFAVSLLFVGFPIVPLSLQFSTCFYIALISIVLILACPGLTKKLEKLMVCFFIIGGVTSYMDFLTTPQLTLGLPMTIYLLSSKRMHKMKLALWMLVIWFLGYASIWASKWGMAYLLTHHHVMAEVTEAAVCRSSTYVFGKDMTLFNMAASVYHILLKHQLLSKFYAMVVIFLALVWIYIKSITSKGILKDNLYLLLIAMIVPVWYLALRNHSLFHYWFTWRAGMLVVFSLIVFIYNTSSWEQLRMNIKRNFKSKSYAK